MAAPDPNTTGNTPPRGRDRTHRRPARTHRINTRLTAAELSTITTAAVAVGLTPSGYLAEAGLAAAHGVPPATLDPMRETLAQLQVELFQARVAVGRIGTNLNQGITALNAIGQAPAWLAHAADLCEQRMRYIDSVIARVDHALE